MTTDTEEAKLLREARLERLRAEIRQSKADQHLAALPGITVAFILLAACASFVVIFAAAMKYIAH